VAAAQQRKDRAAQSPFLDAFEEVSEAVESGAGLPAVVRAAGHALDASVVVLGADSAVLAVACHSPEDERSVLAGEGDTEVIDLRVADQRAGQLRLRPRSAPPPAALLRMVSTLIGQEVDRSRAPERASEAAVVPPRRRHLTLRVDEGVAPSFLSDLRDVARSFPGEHELRLEIGDRRLVLGDAYRLSGCSACRADLAALVGGHQSAADDAARVA